MANQPYQGNRPQQQQQKPQAHVVSPGTPATIATPTLTDVVDEVLGLEKEALGHHSTEEELFFELTIPEQFKRIVGSGLEDVIKGLVSPRQVKNDIRAWFEDLTIEQMMEYREQLKDAAKYIQSQVEDVINEVPQLVM